MPRRRSEKAEKRSCMTSVVRLLLLSLLLADYVSEMAPEQKVKKIKVFIPHSVFPKQSLEKRKYLFFNLFMSR